MTYDSIKCYVFTWKTGDATFESERHVCSDTDPTQVLAAFLRDLKGLGSLLSMKVLDGGYRA
jgi:hypothetical protein